MTEFLVFASLIGIMIANFYLYMYISNSKHKTTVATAYSICSIMFFFQAGAYLAMIIFDDKIDPYVFEYIAQFSQILVPPTFFIITLLYWIPNTNYKNFLWIYIIPALLLVAIETNHIHGLYYASDLSYNFTEMKLGPLYYLSTAYSYIMMLLPLSIICFYATNGKLKLQRKIILYFVITFMPVIFNILGSLQIFPSWPIFLNCIIFSFLEILIALVILEYKITNLSSYAESLALDNMLDSFMVIDTDSNIIMCNNTFDKTIGKVYNLKLYDNIRSKYSTENAQSIKKLEDIIKKINSAKKPLSVRHSVIIKGVSYIYNVDISQIKLKNLSLGYLILYKDITNHLTHLNTIKEQRNIIFSQDRLATIGKLASSFAQDINTPLKRIEKGIKELKKSNLFERDDLDIFGQMESCKERISDIAANLVSTYTPNAEKRDTKFEINETILSIKHIVASELKKYDCSIHIETAEPLYLMGNKTKFSQVITNLIVNAIQAYDKNTGGSVYVNILKTKTKVIINIIDNAGGIDEKIKDNLFKKVVTTKGGKGTGLGLRLSHSIIKEDFDGTITFESDKLGTTFSVSIPINT